MREPTFLHDRQRRKHRLKAVPMWSRRSFAVLSVLALAPWHGVS
jgi:hypothetical protein